MELIFEKRNRSTGPFHIPDSFPEVEWKELVPSEMRREREVELPELSEVEVVRHYLALSRRQVGVDSCFYPLGSCTMKYNPKVCEETARLGGFSQLHPLSPENCMQGTLKILYELEQFLKAITGVDSFTLCPMAGAQGELTGLLLVRAFHEARGEKRTEVLVPDSPHGTNRASATLAGFRVKHIPSDQQGEVDCGALEKAVGPQTAALMLTNPNTLGLFERNILKIAEIVHEAGALLYYDGANLNALCGVARPGDMGFDIVHLNLHKTFGTPHGGGGPGAGPVGVKKRLEPFLPVPRVVKQGDRFELKEDFPQSIGRLGAFAGNVAVAIRAYAYLRCLGEEGVRRLGPHAVLAARYLQKELQPNFPSAFQAPCMHEFVAKPSAAMLSKGVKTIHVAKRLIDFGFHPPTVYFPLIVEEAIMVEPTETEPKDRLDSFSEALNTIASEAMRDPERLKNAPHDAPVARVDEVKAARELVLTYDDALRKTELEKKR